MNFGSTIKLTKVAHAIKKLNHADNELNKVKSAKYVASLLEDERGLFFKLGQYLGTSADTAAEIKNLVYTNAPAIDLEKVFQIIEESYGKPWNQIFQEISMDAYCASIGQVHRAKLLNGDEVVIKVQYPGLKDEIQQQLKAMNLITAIGSKAGPMKKWGVPIEEYKQLISNTVEEELNFLHEVDNQKKFQKDNKLFSFIKTSKIYDEYALENIYVQSFLNGETIAEVIESWTNEEKKKLANRILESFLMNFVFSGFMQIDSNHGNFLFTKLDSDTEINYLDFGNCTQYSEDFRLSLLKLIKAAQYNQAIDPFYYLVGMGFDKQKLQHIHKQLPLLTKVLFEPFLNSFAFDLDEWQLEERIEDILGEYKWWFRSSGSVEFFALMKSFLGTKNLIHKLGQRISWKNIFDRVTKPMMSEIDGFDIKAGGDDGQRYNFNSLAKDLRILVTDNGIEKVNLTFPIATFVDLEDYLEDDVKEKLIEREINIQELIKNSLNKGCFPGEVFFLEDGVKSFKVWLD